MKYSFLIAAAAVLFAGVSAQADILLTHYVPYTQDFDTLASTGTSSLMPADWSFVETGASFNTSYTAGTGSSLTADTYSYGIAGANPVTDRALGEVTAGSLVSTFGAKFQNAGPKPMTKILSIAYTGEQWRNGTTTADRLDFQYSLNATSLTTGTWNDLNTLDFLSPNTTATTGSSLDGNASGNRTLLSLGKTSFISPVAPGATFWIRWTSTDAGGTDDGMAIDDFSITAIPEPSSMALCGFIAGAVGFTMIRRRRKQAVR